MLVQISDTYTFCPLYFSFIRHQLSERHARALLPLPDANARMRIARQAAVKQLTVRQTEEMVHKALQRLPVAPQGRRIISLVRDQRLYLNAIRSIVAQMQEAGIDATAQERTLEGSVELTLRLPTRRGRMRQES